VGEVVEKPIIFSAFDKGGLRGIPDVSACLRPKLLKGYATPKKPFGLRQAERSKE